MTETHVDALFVRLAALGCGVLLAIFLVGVVIALLLRVVFRLDELAIQARLQIMLLNNLLTVALKGKTMDEVKEGRQADK